MRITERKLRSIIRQVIVEQNESFSSESESHTVNPAVEKAVEEICTIVKKAVDFDKLKDLETQQAHQRIEVHANAKTLEYLFHNNQDLLDSQDHITHRVTERLKDESDRQALEYFWGEQ